MTEIQADQVIEILIRIAGGVYVIAGLAVVRHLRKIFIK